MALFLNGKNIEMYVGDTGYITFFGIPTDRIYNMHFSVLTTKRSLLFELRKNSRIAWLDENNDEIRRNEGETEEEYNRRCAEEGGEQKGVVTFFISDDDSNKLTVAVNEMTSIYLYGLKMCYTDCHNNNHEDTLLPPVSYDATGQVIFGNPTIITVYPKFVEGE